MKITKNEIPNIITLFRIVATISLFFFDIFTLPFYIIYTLGGFSDVLDGTLARKWNVQSERGAALDTVADLFFYAVLIVKLFPYLWINASKLIWVYGWSVVGMRVICYTIAALKYKRFTSLHTYGNKITGAVIFSLPYTLHWFDDTATCTACCIIAAIATVEELILHLTSKEYNSKRKTIFSKT